MWRDPADYLRLGPVVFVVRCSGHGTVMSSRSREDGGEGWRLGSLALAVITFSPEIRIRCCKLDLASRSIDTERDPHEDLDLR